jgi:hypothetical protein
MKETKADLIKRINKAPIPAKKKRSLIKMVLRSTSK